MMLLPMLASRQVALFAAVAAGLLARSAFGDWKQDDKTLAWENDGKVVWRFSFDASKGKAFFDPVTVNGGEAITNFKPTDHPWHYGLWFSWKYINHVNYWEEDRTSGKAEGKTAWSAPVVRTNHDGSATIHMDVTYTDPKTGDQDMSEVRDLTISAPAVDGSYAIEWKAHFTAGKNGAILDRTAMPGEPNGQVNGGYAGLAVRMAGQPALMSVVTTSGPVEKFESSRARPNAPAVGCNFTKDGKEIGALAILSDPGNIRPDAPWYLINDNTTNNGEGFRFACAAILAPKIITLKAGETMDLHYQIALSPKAWTPESLKAEFDRWVKK